MQTKPQLVASLITNELSALSNEFNYPVHACGILPGHTSVVADRILDGTIHRNSAKIIFREIITKYDEQLKSFLKFCDTIKSTVN